MGTRRLGTVRLGTGRLGWLAGLATVLLVGATVVVERLAHGHEPIPSLAGQYTYLGLALPLALCGGLITTRRPGNRIGVVLLVTGLAIALDQLTWDSLLYFRSHGIATVWLVGWTANWLWVVAPSALLVGLLLFPDGRLPGPRWRPVAWLVALWSATIAVLAMLDAGVYNYDAHFDAVPLPAAVTRALHGVLLVVFGSFPVMVGAVTAAVVSRFRRARDIERAQFRCLAYAGALVTVVELLPPVHHPGSWPRALANLAQWAVPIGIAVAVLRYRLYQIDKIISRTLVFASLTACVGGAYVLVVTALNEVVRLRSGFWSAAIASAVVAALVAPVRSRLERAIERLLYGQRAEPYAVIARLGRQLEAALPADRVLPTIADTLAVSLKLPYIGIDLLRDDGDFEPVYRRGEAAGELVSFPLTHRGEALGRLLLSPRTGGESFSAQEDALMRDLARHAGVAVHAARLTVDLQRSRERLVNAREEERRRLRRDLHDGLGPALAGIVFRLDATARHLPAQPGRATELLSGVRTDLKGTIGEVRRLVEGLRPPALDELGLLDALREHGARVGDPVVAVEAPHPLPALPAAVEVAAYRIATEAITNVVRHAAASSCTVRLSTDDALHIEITDDGRGLPERRRPGVGLASMRERAAELGGSYDIGPGPGGGTRIEVRLPLAQGLLQDVRP